MSRADAGNWLSNAGSTQHVHHPKLDVALLILHMLKLIPYAKLSME